MSAATAHSADDYPFARELANNATAIATLLAAHVPDEHGMCRTCTRPGSGYRHTPWPCPVASLALLARDIWARATARRLIVANGAATGPEVDKAMSAHGLPPHRRSLDRRPTMSYPQHGHFQPGQVPNSGHLPPAPEKRRRRWPWVLLGVPIGMLVMLILIGNGPTRATAPTTPAASGGSVSAATADAPEAAPPPAPSGPLTTFGPGTWEVGVDIQSGKYKTTGPDGPNCYYARLKNGDGAVGDILDNNNSQGPVTVTIKESDGYFETQGCADWVKAD